MDNRLRTVAGLGISLLVVGILVYLVGFDEFISRVYSADKLFVGGVIVGSIIWLSMWSGAFYIITNHLNIPFGYLDSIRTYATIMFANNVTPFAHLGGEPIAAGFISKIVGEDYEKCLGAISAVSVIHFIPSVLFFVIGSFYIVFIGSGVPESLDALMVSFLVLMGFIVTLGIAVGKFRESLEDKIARTLSLLATLLSKVPRFPDYETGEIKEKVSGYFSNFLSVATNPRVVFFSALASTTGVFFKVISLWLALLAVGVEIPFILILVTVPVAGLASVLPLPGGAGGIEAVMIAILVSLTQFGSPEVTAGVVIMRSTIYWTPVVIGVLNLGYETTT